MFGDWLELRLLKTGLSRVDGHNSVHYVFDVMSHGGKHVKLEL